MPRRTGTGALPTQKQHQKKKKKKKQQQQQHRKKRKPPQQTEPLQHTKPRRRTEPEAKPTPRPTPAVGSRGAVPFPKPNQPPTEAEFLARIPMAAGKKLESLRSFLGKQRGVSESLFYFGPKTGWAYRYLRGEQSVATLMLHAGQLMGIVALDGQALSGIDFGVLSPVGAAARKAAHGSPSLSWLDLPLDGTGAADFKVLVRTKLRTMPPPEAVEPAAGPGRSTPAPGRTSGSTQRRRTPPPPPPPPPSGGSKPPISADRAGRAEAAEAPGRANRL